MANTENREEFAYPAKRKPDLARRETEGEGGEGEDRSSKSLKLEPLENPNHAGGDDDSLSEEPGDGGARGEEGNHSEKAAVVLEESRADAGVEEEEEAEDDDYEDDDDEDEDDDEEEEEEEEDGDDEGDEVDVKGKGIVKDDKGKGKLIVEEGEEGDSGDSSSDDYGNAGVPSESDSDLSDDPLAEVDLDNILPSRTRRRTARPGVFIARDRKDGGEDDRS
ncbi:hypothetical protein BT93_G1337 [Corymbia citriodora subsp. variegata]|nr:hypothetical protein BT93_G1337 [Corymbia citriodora subsp. variegata]